MSGQHRLVQAVMQVAQAQGVCAPAGQEAIDFAERRFGIKLPADMTDFYRSMNGMDWPTESAHGWIRLWPLDSWRRVSEEAAIRDVMSKCDAAANGIIFADHCDESWWYAADFAGQGPELRVVLVDGQRPAKLVAAGFTAFVQAALADAVDIYPNS